MNKLCPFPHRNFVNIVFFYFQKKKKDGSTYKADKNPDKTANRKKTHDFPGPGGRCGKREQKLKKLESLCQGRVIKYLVASDTNFFIFVGGVESEKNRDELLLSL